MTPSHGSTPHASSPGFTTTHGTGFHVLLYPRRVHIADWDEEKGSVDFYMPDMNARQRVNLAHVFHWALVTKTQPVAHTPVELLHKMRAQAATAKNETLVHELDREGQ